MAQTAMQGKRTKLLLTCGILGAVVLLMIWLIPDQDVVSLPPLATNAPCADVLLQLDDATTSWAEVNKKDTLTQPTAKALEPYFQNHRPPACPQGGKLTYGTRALATTCSLHGDALDKRPAKQSSKADEVMHAIGHLFRFGSVTKAARGSCRASLIMIDGAKQYWALENKKAPSDIPMPSDIVPFLMNNQIPICPHHQGRGKYILNAVSTDPTCTRAAVGHTL